MATAELREITRSISAEMGNTVGGIRKAANENQKMFSSILKDMGAHFAAQRSGMDELSSAVETTSSMVASKVDSTNNLLQEQIGVLSNVYAELRSLNRGINTLNVNTLDSSKGLLNGLMGGLRGLQNVIIGGLATAGMGAVGFGAGAGLSMMMGGGAAETDSSVGKGSAEFQNVAPRVMRDLQRDFPGLTREDAAAIVGNLGEESGGFSQMKEAGGKGPGRGWAQWTSPDRKAKFMANVQKHGGDLANYDANYETLKEELKGSYAGALKATMAAQGLQNKTHAFMRQFENPGVPAFDVRMKYAQRAINVSDNQTSPQQTTKADAAPVTKPAATEMHQAETGHAGHEGIITGKHKPEENMSSSEAKDFLQSRGVAQQGAVGVNAEKLDGDFAEKMAKAIKAAEAATGSKVTITEGYRDPHVQAQYYSDYIGKPITYDGKTYQPNPAKLGRLAAPPGRSRHQKGMAMDLAESPAREWLIQNAGKFGIESLFAKIGKDKPHFQAPGAGGEEGQGPALSEATMPQGVGMSPGVGSSVDDRISAMQQNINQLGGGVPGTEQSGSSPFTGMMGIPAHGFGGAVNIGEYMSNIQSNMAQIQQSVASPNLMAPAAAMLSAPTTSEATQTIQQAQVEEQVEDYNYRENMLAHNEQTKKITTEIAASEKTSGTPVIYDYNNANDVGWPDWASIIGGNHWDELRKVKLNMFG